MRLVGKLTEPCGITQYTMSISPNSPRSLVGKLVWFDHAGGRLVARVMKVEGEQATLDMVDFLPPYDQKGNYLKGAPAAGLPVWLVEEDELERYGRAAGRILYRQFRSTEG